MAGTASNPKAVAAITKTFKLSSQVRAAMTPAVSVKIHSARQIERLSVGRGSASQLLITSPSFTGRFFRLVGNLTMHRFRAAMAFALIAALVFRWS